MPIIKIDDKDYDTESLSEEAIAQLTSIQFVDQELARLQAQAAVLDNRGQTTFNPSHNGCYVK